MFSLPALMGSLLIGSVEAPTATAALGFFGTNLGLHVATRTLILGII